MILHFFNVKLQALWPIYLRSYAKLPFVLAALHHLMASLALSLAAQRLPANAVLHLREHADITTGNCAQTPGKLGALRYWLKRTNHWLCRQNKPRDDSTALYLAAAAPYKLLHRHCGHPVSHTFPAHHCSISAGHE